MTDPVLSEVDRDLHMITAAKFLIEEITAGDKQARARLAKQMKRGDTLAVRSTIDDSKMSRVNMSDPDPVAVVTDPAALDEWIRDRYDDRLTTEETIVGSDKDVRAVLRQHAGHLLMDVTSVPDHLVSELLTLSTAAGEPVDLEKHGGDDAPPGIEVRTPEPKLSLTVDRKTGPEAFRAMWESGVYAVDGRIAALPGGEDRGAEG